MRKKLFAALLLSVMIFSLLCSCQQKGDNKKEVSSQLPVIKVGCDDYPPFTYTDVNGNLTGIDVDLAKEAFSRLGYQPEFTIINWEDKKELLADGTIDCVWSSFTMDGREDEYKWAGPYMQSNQVIAVNEGSDIQSIDDLEGKVIAVQSTTKPEDMIRSHDGTFPELRKVISVQKRDLIFILLSKGYVDALAAHETSVDQFESDTGLKFRVLDEPLLEVGLGVAFDKNNDSGLNDQLSKTLSDMTADGTTEKIIGKYLSEPQRYLEAAYEK